MSVNILIGCTGSVAAIKIPELVDKLLELDLKPNIKVVVTENAQRFFNKDDVNATVLCDSDEWEAWSKIGDPVLHIELRRWADLMIISPLDANTLAKIASGICDNLLTTVVRAWDINRPLLFATAMNTYMWEHPISKRHVGVLKEFGYIEVPCIFKLLACGDKGYGGMAEVQTLVSAVVSALSHSKKDKESPAEEMANNACCL